MFNSIDAASLIKTKAKLEERGGKVRRVLHSGETEEQAALVKWASVTVINGWNVGQRLIHFPNEGKRGPKAAKDFKRLGGKAGYPDLILDIPNRKYHGLRIEMKSKTGKCSPEQVEMLKRLNDDGYLAVVCRSFEEAKEVIASYLEDAEDGTKVSS